MNGPLYAIKDVSMKTLCKKTYITNKTLRVGVTVSIPKLILFLLQDMKSSTEIRMDSELHGLLCSSNTHCLSSYAPDCLLEAVMCVCVCVRVCELIIKCIISGFQN